MQSLLELLTEKLYRLVRTEAECISLLSLRPKDHHGFESHTKRYDY